MPKTKTLLNISFRFSAVVLMDYKFFIGSIPIKYGVMLAPMAGVTDKAFRRICRENGAEYMVSEMISAKALIYGDKKTPALAAVYAEEKPLALQIFGSEPETMAQAAKILSETPTLTGGNTPSAIDINMGCPVPKVAGNGEGSALMRQPVLAGKIMQSVRNATKLPVTVKIRTGWNALEKNCVEIAKIAVSCGMDMICVHGRTREQQYEPPVDLDSIAAVRQAVPAHIPVIGNGGIDSPESALHMIRYTGCDGIMLARGVRGNPWLFQEILAHMQGKKYKYPTKMERLQTALRQVRIMMQDKGERIGLLEARKHLAWYTRGMPDSAALRHAINRAENYTEIEHLFYDHLTEAPCSLEE